MLISISKLYFWTPLEYLGMIHSFYKKSLIYLILALYAAPTQVVSGLKSEARFKCLKPAVSLMASRGQLHWLQKKSSCIEVYEKMTQCLTWFITSVNTFLMSLWSQSLVSSIQVFKYSFCKIWFLRVKQTIKQRMQPQQHWLGNITMVSPQIHRV